MFQFYIKEINKYSFCKFIDFTHVNPFQGLLAKVFNRFTDEEVSSLDELNRTDWLFGERIMFARPDLRKDSGWKYIGMLNSLVEYEIPVFKEVQAFPSLVEDNYSIGPWYPVSDFGSRGPDCSYEKVKHLETKLFTTTLGIERRAGMEYCRINNIDVSLYYDLNDKGVLNAFWQMINVPVYGNIPKEIRGKSLSYDIGEIQ